MMLNQMCHIPMQWQLVLLVEKFHYLEEIIDNLELIIEAIEYLQDYDLGDFKDPQGR